MTCEDLKKEISSQYRSMYFSHTADTKIKKVVDFLDQLEEDAKIGVAMKEWWSCETATVDDCATKEILFDWYDTQDSKD